MQLFNIDSFSAHLWIFLLSLCVLSQKETTQTVVNVKGYEDVTAVTVDIDPESEPVYILNFSKPQPGDFLHVVLNIDCSCTNRTGRTMEIEVARNTDNSFEKWEPAVISRTHTLGLCNDYSFVTWMMKFDEFDCYKHRHCFFAIRMGTSQTCKAELLVERGMRVEYGDNHIFDINPNTRMIRLFEYYPRQAPQSLTISQLSRHKQAAVSVYGRWHLFYSWGYTLDRHMKTLRGQSTVSLDKNRYPWTAGDRLLLWFEAPAGQYGIEFLEDGDSNFLISSVMIISFLSCTFCCTFCLTFCCVYFVSKRTFHIISDSNEPPVSAPEPPAVATQDELVANTKLWRYSKQIAKKLKLKNKECIICLDKFEKDDIIRLLACGHSFHQACIDPWLTTRRKECPLCHQSLNEAQNFFRSVSGGTSDRGTSGSLSSLLSMSNWKASRSPRKSARQSQSHSRNSKSDSCSNPFQARMKNVTGKVQIEIFRTKGAKPGYKIQLVPTETDTSDMAPYQKICDGKINKNQPSNFSLDVSSCHSSTSSSLPSQLCHLINQEFFDCKVAKQMDPESDNRSSSSASGCPESSLPSYRVFKNQKLPSYRAFKKDKESSNHKDKATEKSDDQDDHKTVEPYKQTTATCCSDVMSRRHSNSEENQEDNSIRFLAALLQFNPHQESMFRQMSEPSSVKKQSSDHSYSSNFDLNMVSQFEMYE